MKPGAQVSNKKRKVKHEDGNGAAHNDPPPSPNWLSLPDDILRKLFDYLSIPDMFAFSSVCTNLRSFLPRSHCLLGPPLLLCSIPNPPRICGQPIHSSICRIKPLTPYTRRLSCMISTTILNNDLCGNSYGQLIFSAHDVTITDVFTGKEIHSPKLPYCEDDDPCSLAILTSNPSTSSSCFLVCARYNTDVDGYEIMSWQVGTDDDWSSCTLTSNADQFYPVRRLHSMLFFHGQVFLLFSDCRVFILQLGPALGWQLLVEDRRFFDNTWPFSLSLVECDGELLSVHMVSHGQSESWIVETRIEVRKLDILNRSWVQVDNIGDWCLFLDGTGNTALACKNPGRWGGQANSIYIPSDDYETWNVYPLDAISYTTIDPCYGDEWPVPLWVYPSRLLL